MADFIPNSDDALKTWCTNFKTKIATAGAAVGLAPAWLQGQENWKFLARDTVPPYIDTTPLAAAGKPEIREYRIRGVVNDEEIGDYSDTVQVTVT